MSGHRSAAAGLSHWWPTPARPADHFTADELSRSTELHRPVRRARLLLGVARTTLLVAGAAVLTIGPIGDRLTDASSWLRALVASIVVVAAVRLPEPAVRWRLARLPQVELVVADRPSVAASGAATAAPALVLAVIGPSVLALLVDPARGWLVVLGSVAVSMIVGIVSTGAQVRRAVPVDPPPSWDRLIRRTGASGVVEFGALAEPGRSARLNACALGYRSERRVLVSAGVVAAGAAPLGDDAGPDGPADGRAVDRTPDAASFVVAHELRHLAGRHPEIQLGLGALVVAAAVGAVAALGPTGWPWSVLGADPADPAALPLTVLVAGAGGLVARLPVAWVLRGLERVADGGAVDAVGVLNRADALSLHLGPGAELEPPRLAQLLAAHPAPAERLEYLARRRSPPAGP